MTPSPWRRTPASHRKVAMMAPKHLGDEWLSTHQAAEALGVTVRGLYRLIDEGRVPAYKMGRVIRLRRADLDQVQLLSSS